jgi:hypothetical protein
MQFLKQSKDYQKMLANRDAEEKNPKPEEEEKEEKAKSKKPAKKASSSSYSNERDHELSSKGSSNDESL